MAAFTSQSVLCNAALESGLLSQQQLDDALAGLAREAAKSGGGTTVESITDEALGQRLVDVGYLNRWQVEQLKEGRTKFTLGPYRIVNAIGQGGMTTRSTRVAPDDAGIPNWRQTMTSLAAGRSGQIARARPITLRAGMYCR